MAVPGPQATPHILEGIEDPAEGRPHTDRAFLPRKPAPSISTITRSAYSHGLTSRPSWSYVKG